ncbi:MAG: DUF6431 domain-containing protein [Eubacteriales bacterium]|nr:DUF6431 domain-containing protein [Eubacteriales bacterium]
MQEKTPCPQCGRMMKYWYSRKRGVIISDHKYIFMAPRFKCTCGRTMTMRPYFIALRKQYSIFSIQEILNADISYDHIVSAAYGSSMVAGFRKWAVALVKGIVADQHKTVMHDERSVVRTLYQQEGSLWLSSFLQKESDSEPFSMHPCLSG